jgi:hypothetical protein
MSKRKAPKSCFWRDGVLYGRAGFKPAARTSNGHYAQTIQQLRKLAAKRSATAP